MSHKHKIISLPIGTKTKPVNTRQKADGGVRVKHKHKQPKDKCMSAIRDAIENVRAQLAQVLAGVNLPANLQTELSTAFDDVENFADGGTGGTVNVKQLIDAALAGFAIPAEVQINLDAIYAQIQALLNGGGGGTNVPARALQRRLQR